MSVNSKRRPFGKEKIHVGLPSKCKICKRKVKFGRICYYCKKRRTS